MSDHTEFNAYQAFTRTTAIYPGAMTGSTSALVYCLFGLGGETGEIQEKVKKIIRGSTLSALDQLALAADNKTSDDLIKEIGDALYYLARFADELGVPLAEVARRNVEKLSSRKERGVLHGSGDAR